MMASSLLFMLRALELGYDRFVYGLANPYISEFLNLDFTLFIAIDTRRFGVAVALNQIPLLVLFVTVDYDVKVDFG